LRWLTSRTSAQRSPGLGSSKTGDGAMQRRSAAASRPPISPRACQASPLLAFRRQRRICSVEYDCLPGTSKTRGRPNINGKKRFCCFNCPPPKKIPPNKHEVGARPAVAHTRRLTAKAQAVRQRAGAAAGRSGRAPCTPPVPRHAPARLRTPPCTRRFQKISNDNIQTLEKKQKCCFLMRLLDPATHR
jgi:hypothetical protein